ncbi:MAG: hypothetical protein H7833_06860 [Magnetococcus sp. DMHC-1]|nr:hypothetical protein [Magnetococcales bacterium]
MTFAVDKSWAAIFAQRQMGRSSTSQKKPFRRLASGALIHEESEDDSEYDFLSGMNVRIRELNQALRHVNDGISLAQLAGEGLREMESALSQIRIMLDPQGILADKRMDLGDIQMKIRTLIEEIDRIAQETQAVDGSLIQDNARIHRFQAGKEGAIPVPVAGTGVGTRLVDSGPLKKSTVGMDVENIAGRVEKAMNNVTDIRSDLRNVLNKFELAVVGMNTMAENVAASRVRNLDLPSGNQVTRQVRNTVLQEADTALRAQANHPARAVLTLLN